MRKLTFKVSSVREALVPAAPVLAALFPVVLCVTLFPGTGFAQDAGKPVSAAGFDNSGAVSFGRAGCPTFETRCAKRAGRQK